MMVSQQNAFVISFTFFLVGIIGYVSIKLKGEFLIFGVSLVVLLSTWVFILSVLQNNSTIRTLILLSTISIFLTPSLSISGANFRAEDYIAIFMVIALIETLIRTGRIINKVSILIASYLLYSLLITGLNYILGDIRPIYFLFLVKEVQFFVYFYIFMYVAFYFDKLEPKLYRLIFSLALVNIGWGLLQIFTGIKAGYYGIGVINDTSSSQSGGIFLITTLFMLYYMGYLHRKWNPYLLGLTLLSAGMTVATISRTAIMALCLSVGVYCAFKLMFPKKGSTTNLKIYIGIASTLIVSGLIFGSGIIQKVFNRINKLSSGANGRLEKWEGLLSHSNVFDIIIGKGKGYTQELTGGLTLSADSQYVRLLLEVGIVGLIFWLFIILYLLNFSLKNLNSHYNESVFLLLLIVAFMIMGVTHEVFLVSLQASAFWSIAGFMVGVIMKKKRKEIHTLKNTKY